VKRRRRRRERERRGVMEKKRTRKENA